MAADFSGEIEWMENQPPFSKSQVRKLGRSLLKNTDFPEEERIAIENWHREFALRAMSIVKNVVEDVVGEKRAEHAIRLQSIRLKTNKTITEKLKRNEGGDRPYNLAEMQDYVGGRFVLDCFHSELFKIFEKVKGRFANSAISVRCVDRISSPMQGYRAVHVVIERPSYGKVEIQLRTILQSAWANAYEKASDVFGRSIRYGEHIRLDGPAAMLVSRLQTISDNILDIETTVQTNFERTAELDKQILELSMNPTHALPLNPEYYRHLSLIYESKAKAARSNSDLAQSNRGLISSLQQLEISLVALNAHEKEERNQ